MLHTNQKKVTSKIAEKEKNVKPETQHRREVLARITVFLCGDSSEPFYGSPYREMKASYVHTLCLFEKMLKAKFSSSDACICLLLFQWETFMYLRLKFYSYFHMHKTCQHIKLWPSL